jgi:hypothetical protein
MILSPTHNINGDRGDIHNMFCRRMSRVRDQFDIEMMVIGSDGDVSKNMTEGYGHLYYEYPNKPVSNKWNGGMAKIREYEPDYVMMLDSDDFLSDSLFEEYVRLVNTGAYNMIGVVDSYFVSFHLKRAHFDKCFYWPGYGKRDVIMGCSKVVSREILDAVDWAPWPDGRGGGLNNHFHKKVSSAINFNYKRGVISVKGGNHLHIDIKTNGNISSIATLWKEKKLLDFAELVHAHLPKDEADFMEEYREMKLIQYANRKK